MSFDEAIMIVRSKCPNIYAQWFADSAMDIAETKGTPGLIECANGIIKNIRNWHHPETQNVRKALQTFIKRHTDG